ncbi:MAG TPA: 4a-hydroxytetrahydrobiopterin dehydratase [Anaerolineales bacterium]|nr:4a-hydroxytetrahydrobiopterin dehydratase [Anaerolineales bacterium]
MSDLREFACVPCRGGVPPLTRPEIESYLPQVPEWQVLEVEGIPRLQKEFKFNNFAQALAFTNQVGEIAEAEGHHPALLTEWGRVTVSWWTHKIKGLHRNDFIMAAKTDAMIHL